MCLSHYVHWSLVTNYMLHSLITIAKGLGLLTIYCKFGISRNMIRSGFCVLVILTSISATRFLQLQGSVYAKVSIFWLFNALVSQVPLGSAEVYPKETPPKTSLGSLLPSHENCFLLVPRESLFQRLDWSPWLVLQSFWWSPYLYWRHANFWNIESLLSSWGKYS